jgi:3-polyprenyl-4-hydroxybenzoate decarboxylase
MLKLSRMGVVIAPPLPAFYNHPKSIAELVDHTVVRLLDLFDIHTDAKRPWTGILGMGLPIEDSQPAPRRRRTIKKT